MHGSGPIYLCLREMPADYAGLYQHWNQETRPRAFVGLAGAAQPAGYAPAVLLPELGQLGQEPASPDLSRFGRL
jgi:hypothetical protein